MQEDYGSNLDRTCSLAAGGADEADEIYTFTRSKTSTAETRKNLALPPQRGSLLRKRGTAPVICCRGPHANHYPADLTTFVHRM